MTADEHQDDTATRIADAALKRFKVAGFSGTTMRRTGPGTLSVT